MVSASRFMRRLAYLVVLATLVAPGIAHAGPSPATAGWLSVLLPGAGHVYAGDSNKGLTLMGLYGGALGIATGRVTLAVEESLSGTRMWNKSVAIQSISTPWKGMGRP